MGVHVHLNASDLLEVVRDCLDLGRIRSTFRQREEILRGTRDSGFLGQLLLALVDLVEFVDLVVEFFYVAVHLVITRY